MMDLSNNTILLLLPLVGIFSYIIYCNYARYTHSSQLPKKRFNFKGIVASVGDGDGFKVVHVPLLRSSKVKNIPSLKVRLAGIDAPEVRYFNKPEQPYAKQAKQYLSDMILKKMVYVDGLKLDCYGRILAIVYVRYNLFFWKNVNLEMLKSGLACVYESNNTSFGDLEKEMRLEEKQAMKKKKGMWSLGKSVILPMDYKKLFWNK